MKKIGIVIFDMDDTLVDKETVFIEAQEAMLRTLAGHDSRIDPKKDFNTLREIDHELIGLHRGKHMYEYWKLALSTSVLMKAHCCSESENEKRSL